MTYTKVKMCLNIHNAKTYKIGIIILYLMTMMFYMIPDLSKAEENTCIPDCFEDNFGPIDSIHFSIGPCNFVMYYYFRKACEEFCDFLPVQIRCYSQGCEQMDMKWVIDVAMVQLILRREKNEARGLNCYPNLPGQCTIQWRVVKGACWKYILNASYDPMKPMSPGNYLWYLGKCSRECCLVTYEVCMNEYMQLIIAPYEIQTDDCGTNPDPECFPVCEN